ncbi:hypothetical protein JCGZ_24974 [Jatropha curcas]|uniref:Uncharacterized protein n=1 Tax=Jatropha curcas TaxID=180498 RepID=A0A067L8Z7_JATCU|nr:hypothetical protein JCGZ_24974 [Jatropha curcas]
MASSRFFILVILIIALSFSGIGVSMAARRSLQEPLFGYIPRLDLPPLPGTGNTFPVPPVVRLPPYVVGRRPSFTPFSFPIPPSR